MKQPISDILQQLGDAISAQLAAANDRAASAETEYARLRDGLRTLLGGEPTVKEDNVSETSAASSMKVRGRTSISNEPFFDALTFEWQSAHALRNAMIASGVKVAFGTVYKRMKKLAADFPYHIESEIEPDRWRLRAPTGANKDRTPVVAKTTPVKSRTEKKPPANDMPPLAITNVPALIATQPSPREVFEPDLRHGDCVEIMKMLPENSVDLIVTDPPYGTTRLDIDPLIDLDRMWAEYRRIITQNGTIVTFGSQPFSSRLVCGAPDLFKHGLIWIKGRPTGAFHASNFPMKQHEDILVFSAGATIHETRSSRRYTYHPLGQTSAGVKVISENKATSYLPNLKHHGGLVYEGTTNNPRSTIYCPKDRGNLHPFQKPVDLIEYLIRTYSNEGDMVFDPFVGSGSTCVAAIRSGRRSIGIEMDTAHFTTAEKRLRSTVSAKAV